VSGRSPVQDELDGEPLPKQNSQAALIAIGTIGLAAGLLCWLLFKPAPMAVQPAPATAEEPASQGPSAAAGAKAPSTPTHATGAPGNHPPKAVIRMRQDPIDQANVEYSALFSEDSDPGDEDHLAAHWDFGDGTTGDASEGHHRFVASGTLTMVLTITDPKGGMATDKVRITVPGPALALPAAKAASQVAGLRCQRIRGRIANFAAFDAMLPGADEMTALDVGLDLRPGEVDYGLRFTGYLAIPTAGDWTFIITSDDGSRLRLGDAQVAMMDTMQGATSRSARVRCEAGLIPLQVDFYQGGGGAELRLEWAGPGRERQAVPASAYFHSP
jgi:hypothetical protein